MPGPGTMAPDTADIASALKRTVTGSPRIASAVRAITGGCEA